MNFFALYTRRPPVTALKLKKIIIIIEGRYKILTLKLRALNQKGAWTSDTEQNTQKIILSQSFHWSYHRTYNRGN